MAGAGEVQIRVYGDLKIKSGFLDVRNTTAFTTNGSVFYLWNNAARIAEIASSDPSPFRNTTVAKDVNDYYTANVEGWPFQAVRGMPTSYGLSTLPTINSAAYGSLSFRGFWDIIAPILTDQRIDQVLTHFSGGVRTNGIIDFSPFTFGPAADCAGDPYYSSPNTEAWGVPSMCAGTTLQSRRRSRTWCGWYQPMDGKEPALGRQPLCLTDQPEAGYLCRLLFYHLQMGWN